MMTTATMKETVQSTATKQGFNQITGNSGAALFVSNKGANHPNSMKVLEDANLRPLTRQEALPLLMRDEALKEALKGKWFYLAGAGMDKSGLFTINYMGELVEGAEKVALDERVYVYKGANPLCLLVHSDYYAAQGGRRFALYADDVPYDVAPVVVGVAKDFKLELKPGVQAAGREAAAPQNSVLIKDVTPEEFNVLLRKADASVNELSGNVAEKTLEPIKQLIRAIEVKE